MRYPRIVLAGTSSGVGKTILTMGLIAALKKRGLKVQPFKTGPDYIDPSYHTLASKRNCHNLDTWMLSRDVILELFERKASKADISVIEGVMGLYDGLKDTAVGSSAHLAKITKSPVILIVDASSMSRSAAALVLGYKEFDKNVNLRGVILNNIGSPAHYNSVKSTIEKKTGLTVLGFLPRDKKLTLPERHLGLIPAFEEIPLEAFNKRLLNLVEKNIDVTQIIEISKRAKSLPQPKITIFTDKPPQDKITIAVARDRAFNFYYQDNLDILCHNGADLIEFSALSDKMLPHAADGLYIGGGFPELFARGLSKNYRLRNDIYAQAKQGLPIYAECGGLMYLTKELIDFKNRSFPMAGIFDASARMGNRRKALGYCEIEVLRDNILTKKGVNVRAHVFHWSYIDGMDKRCSFAYRLKKGGESPSLDGLTKWNVLASYSHLHFGSDTDLADNFIKSCSVYKNKRCRNDAK